ncbi:MAG: hypothetical protein K2K56_02815 [Lachnospiraceae bacterium]|nr:hypothetical protein [Lachnospiraceae bacterium]
MNYESFTSTKEFKSLHPVKQKILQEVINNNMHASPEAILPKLLSINKELSRRNLSFTSDETSLLINIMKANMTPDEQRKVDMLMGLFQH